MILRCFQHADEAVEAVRSSIQAAHMVAETTPALFAQVAGAIITGAEQSFGTGMGKATFIASILRNSALIRFGPAYDQNR